jgi:uncharacterized protein (DUF433 family)
MCHGMVHIFFLKRENQAGKRRLTGSPSKKTYICNMDLLSRITINPEICHGKPTIRGLRYPVDNMLELLASGMSFDEILTDYPDLEKEDLLACIEYAAKLTQIKSIYRIAS